VGWENQPQQMEFGFNLSCGNVALMLFSSSIVIYCSLAVIGKML